MIKESMGVYKLVNFQKMSVNLFVYLLVVIVAVGCSGQFSPSKNPTSTTYGKHDPFINGTSGDGYGFEGGPVIQAPVEVMANRPIQIQITGGTAPYKLTTDATTGVFRAITGSDNRFEFEITEDEQLPELMIQVEDQQGLKGSHRIEVIGINRWMFNNLQKVERDSQGNFVALDPETYAVKIYNPEGVMLGEVGPMGKGEQQVQEAYDFAINSQDQIYVVDKFNRRIQVYEWSGRFVKSLTEYHPPTYNMTYEYQSPEFIRFDEQDNLYLPDRSARRIQVLDPSDRPSLSIGSISCDRQELWCQQSHYQNIYTSNPLEVLKTADDHFLVLNSYFFGRMLSKISSDLKLKQNISFSHEDGVINIETMGDKIYVLLSGQDSIYGFGKESYAIKTYDLNLKETDFLELGEGPYSRLSVSEAREELYLSGYDGIQVFDKNLSLMRGHKSSGFSEGEFDNPTDIALDKAANRLYVADQNNHRIQIFHTSGQHLSNVYGDAKNQGLKFNRPSQIHLGANGEIIVVDEYDVKNDSFQRIQVFDNEFNRLSEFFIPPSSDYYDFRVLGLNFEKNEIIVSKINISYSRSNYTLLTHYNFAGEVTTKYNFDDWLVAIGGRSHPLSLEFVSSSEAYLGVAGAVLQVRFRKGDDYLSSSEINRVTWTGQVEYIRRIVWNFELRPNTFGRITPRKVVHHDAILYVTDSASNHLIAHDLQNNHSVYYGGQGQRLGEFRGITDIEFLNLGVAYILDQANNRIQIISLR